MVGCPAHLCGQLRGLPSPAASPLIASLHFLFHPQKSQSLLGHLTQEGMSMGARQPEGWDESMVKTTEGLPTAEPISSPQSPPSSGAGEMPQMEKSSEGTSLPSLWALPFLGTPRTPIVLAITDLAEICLQRDGW